MMPITIPTLLADIEGFFGIVFFLIAFVGWIINLVNQNQEANKRKPNRPNTPQRNAPRKNVQNEIDQFLKQSQRSTRRTRTGEPEEVEVISPPRRRPPQRRRRTREEILAEQSGQQAHTQQPQPVASTTKTMSERREERLTQSSSKKSAPKRPEQSRLAKQIEIDLPHAIDQHVSSYMREFSAASPTSTGQMGIESTTRNKKSQANLIGKLLRSKNGVRNAIILNEILSPPKSQRK